MPARITLADVTLGNKLVIEIAGRSRSGFQSLTVRPCWGPASAADAQADLPAAPPRTLLAARARVWLMRVNAVNQGWQLRSTRNFSQITCCGT